MNFFIYLTNEGISKILPFITLLFVAKYVDVESFGKLTLYYVILEVLTIVISNNIRATTRIDYFRLNKKRYVESKSAHNMGSFFLLIVILLVSLFTNILEFKYYFVLSITAYMRGVAYFVLSHLQCQENAKLYGFYNIIPIFITNSMFIITIISGYSVESWFCAIFFGTSIQFVFIYKYIKTNELFDKIAGLDYKNIFKEFKNGLIFMPQAVGFWINTAADRSFISLILGNIIVGYYMFVFQLATPIVIFSTVVNLYLTPKINKYLKDQQFENIKFTFFKFTIFLFLFSLINYILIEIIIKYYYYEKYINALDYVIFVVISQFLQANYLIYMNLFYYIDKKKFISMLIFILSLIKVIVVYISLNLYNIEGLLYSNILLDTCILIYTLKKLNIELKNLEGKK